MSRPQCDDCRFIRAFPVVTSTGRAMLCLGCIAALRSRAQAVTYVQSLRHSMPVKTWARGAQ